MKCSFVVLIFAGIFVACTYAANDYTFGTIGATDFVISKAQVNKLFILGGVVTEDYVFSLNGAALTITAVKVTDNKPIKGATATLVSGGAGGTGATVRFTSQRGFGIKSTVEIYGHA